MKNFFIKIGVILLCGAALCGCGKTSGYPREKHTKEMLKEAYIFIGENGEPEYDYYYAYSATGELMFTFKEYAYDVSGINGITSVNWYWENTLQTATYTFPREKYMLTVDTIYDSTKREKRRDSLLTYDGGLQYLSEKLFTYSDDKLTSKDYLTNYTPIAKSDVVSSHSVYDKKGRLLESYLVNGKGEEYLAESIEYTKDGEISKLHQFSYDEDEKRTEMVTEYSYDKKGNLLTYVCKNADTGEVTTNIEYTYSYNDDGTIKEQTANNLLSDKTTKNQYLYMKVSDTDFSKDYVGYWKCIQDDRIAYFLELSCNGLICVGNFDSEYGIMTPQICGFYKIQADGTAVCELYENGAVKPDNYLQGAMYIDEGCLIFNKLVFEKES